MNGRKKLQLYFSILLITSIFGGICHANSGLPGLRSVVEKGIKNLFVSSRNYAVARGVTKIPSMYAVEETSKIVAERVLLQLAQLDRLPRKKALRELEKMLQTNHLMGVLAEANLTIPVKKGMRYMFRLTELLGHNRALMRQAVLRQLNAVLRPNIATRSYRALRASFERIVLSGKPLDPDKVLGHMMKNGHEPFKWLKSLEQRVTSSKRGLRVEAEELAACMSVLEPVNDILASHLMSKAVLFRQSFVLAFWRRNPKAVHYFFDRFTTVVVPKLRGKMSVQRMMQNFPEVMMEAFSPNRRSWFILAGFPGKYSKDMALYDVQKALIRMLNIKAINRSKMLGGVRYREYLLASIQEIEQKGFLGRTREFFELRRLRQEVEYIDAYNKAFQGTAFDVLNLTSKDLESVIGKELIEEMTLYHKGTWWKKNLGMMLLTSIYMGVDYYIRTRSEKKPDVQKMRLEDPEMVRDITIMIEIAERRYRTLKDPDDKRAYRYWINQMKEERKKYREK